MADPRQTLRPNEIQAASLDDWRQVMRSIRARFTTGDFATGLALVQRIGEAAEQADHHPDVRLSYGEVLVDLASHDVGGITSRDLDLARRISELAGEAGVRADTAGLTQLDLGLDTAAGESHAAFYAALLGATIKNGEPVDESGQVSTLWWQGPGEEGPALPESSFEQRWHLDVWVPVDEGERRLEAVLAAGGRLVSDAAAPSYWVVEDCEGNRSCICTVANRWDEDPQE